MPTHIALLRAINVGGRNRIAMAELRTLVESLGFMSVRTLLQSGNLLLEGPQRPDAIERLLEDQTKSRFDLSISYLVRSAQEWDAIIARNPFTREAERDPSHTVVMLLKEAPEPDAVERLRAAIKGPETLHAHGRELYLVYPSSIGTSKLTNTVIESKLATRGTGRNWNTVLKLAALARG